MSRRTWREGPVWSGQGPLFVLGVLERGRVAEGLGEREKAKGPITSWPMPGAEPIPSSSPLWSMREMRWLG
ncbi:MAG: hypothetical protein H0U55_13020 [Rubrobacteraceae bacterium]|nr:hypothetical protein [Rubrobacteraceae bacterium]